MKKSCTPRMGKRRWGEKKDRKSKENVLKIAIMFIKYINEKIWTLNESYNLPVFGWQNG